MNLFGRRFPFLRAGLSGYGRYVWDKLGLSDPSS